MSQLVSAVVADADLDAGSQFVIVEWTAEPSSSEREPIAPLHVHHDDDEAWYVLSGRLGFSLDGREVEVGAGGAAMATAGTVHTYWNAGPEPARYLLIMTPRIRDLIATLHDPARQRGRTMAEIFADHRSAIVAPSGQLEA